MKAVSFKVTPRDAEVVRLLLWGFSNNEIAELLGILPRTVKQHIRILCLRAGIQEGRKRVLLANLFRTQSILNMDALSVTETAVAQRVRAGKTNAQIAKELGIKEQGVKNHLRDVFDKLGVWTRLELAMK